MPAFISIVFTLVGTAMILGSVGAHMFRRPGTQGIPPPILFLNGIAGSALIFFEPLIGVMVGMIEDITVPTSDSQPEPGPTADLDPSVLIVIGGVCLGLAAIIGAVMGVRSLLRRRAEKKAEASAALALRIRQFGDLLARHDASLDEWRAHTANDAHLGSEERSMKGIENLLRYPVLSDLEEPVIEAHLRSAERARDLRPDGHEQIAGPVVGSDYYEAVGDLERAWSKALGEAKRIADSKLSEVERKLLKEARTIFPLLMNSAAQPGEIANAATRLEKIMRRLRLVGEDTSPAVLHSLEQAKSGQRMLTGSPVSGWGSGRADDLKPRPSLRETAQLARHRLTEKLRSAMQP